MSVVVRVQDRGRLVLPAELRRRLGVRAGDELLALAAPEGGVWLLPRRAAADVLIGSAGRWQPGQPSMVEALLADRRAEAALEAAPAPPGAPRRR